MYMRCNKASTAESDRSCPHESRTSAVLLEPAEPDGTNKLAVLRRANDIAAGADGAVHLSLHELSPALLHGHHATLVAPALAAWFPLVPFDLAAGIGTAG